MAGTKKRDRGCVLTDAGYKKIWAAVYEVFPDRQTYAAIAKWTEPGEKNPNAVTYITAETISKILNQREGVDYKKLDILFRAFGLVLQDGDHVLFNEKSRSKSDPTFVGREKAFVDLDALIKRGAKVIVIKAAGGVGKTTLAKRYLSQVFGSYLEFTIATETKDIASAESLLEERIRQLGEEPGLEFLVTLDRLKRKLQKMPTGILIDNLEPALDAAGLFIEPHRRYVELLRVLADPTVQSTTLITSRERLREWSISTQHYLLPKLSLSTWIHFFDSQGLKSDESLISPLHEAYGGNAKAMEIVSRAISEDSAGNIKAYWDFNHGDLLIERDLEGLVSEQFERLKKLVPDAYKLLCRMGCYRYQDVPKISPQGLYCLLWDSNERSYGRTIKSLQDRALIEFSEGYYWMHPVIRQESIERLKREDDYTRVSSFAAKYFTESVAKVENVEDVKKAFEAFYHYAEIGDFDNACLVVTKERENSFGWLEPLNISADRLSLSQSMISIIELRIENILKKGTSPSLCGLLDAMGDMYWDTNINQAIVCYRQSINLADEIHLQTYKMLSRFNLGLCNIALYELEEADAILCESKKISQDNGNLRYSIYCSFCLAYIAAEMGDQDKALKLVSYVERELTRVDITSWGKGYSLLFLGLTFNKIGSLEKSLKVHEDAIDFSNKSNYVQIRAKALCGMIELYRLMKDYKNSLAMYNQAFPLVREIGAAYDLAEVQYQCALTHAYMGNITVSNEMFSDAIIYFKKMKSEKQVSRVLDAIKLTSNLNK